MEAVFLLLSLGAAVWAVRERAASRRLLRRLGEMLERAEAGQFREEVFDESRLSALETKLAHTLSAGALSREAVEAEKVRIQSLLTDLSHQIKTPAANVLLYAQLLAEQSLAEEGRTCAAALEAQAEKLRCRMGIGRTIAGDESQQFIFVHLHGFAWRQIIRNHNHRVFS